MESTLKDSAFKKTTRRIAETISQRLEVSPAEPPTIVEVSSSRQTHGFDVADALVHCRLARLDEREDVLDAAMLEAEERGVPLFTLPCPATAPALKDGSVDAFITFETSWSALAPSDVDLRFAEIFRCLRPGGMIFVLGPKASPPDRLEHRLEAAGLEILSMDRSSALDLVIAIKRNSTESHPRR